jgi:O-antigen/teichoic acid export membrane protein
MAVSITVSFEEPSIFASRARHLVAHGCNYLMSLSGEGVQSGFHFALNLVLISVMTPHDYGMFAIILIIGGIGLTYGNALVSLPASVHIPKVKSRGAVNFLDVVFGSAAVVLCVGMAALVAGGLWLANERGAEALAAGAFVGLWTLRNHVRVAMFARKAMSVATVSDLSYSATGIALVAALILSKPTASLLVPVLLALVVANVIGIAVALGAARRPVRLSLRRGVRARFGAIWSEIIWSLVWVTTWNIQGQAQTFLVAAMVGPAAYAPIAAGLVLYNPLRTAVAALINVVRPEFAAGLAEGRDKAVKSLLLATFGAIVLAWVGYSAAVWLAWGFLDAHIYGEKFADAAMPLIVTLAGLSALASQAYHMPLTLVQAARDFKAVAIASIAGGLTGLAAVVVLLLVSTVAWSLAGVVVGEAVCLIYLWGSALRILSRRSTQRDVHAARYPLAAR